MMNDRQIDPEQQNITGIIPIPPPGFRSGFISIIGRPNVGKSTIMNQLIGQKIAITSPVAQTTRNRLRGILTNDKAQLIFIDTPGIHKPHHELGKVLVTNAREAIAFADAILFVVDSSTPAGGGDRFIVNLLEKIDIPIILGLNKCDRQTTKNVRELDESYTQFAIANNWPAIKFSALSKQGLKTLLDSLIERLETGPYYYPPDLVTDKPERFIMGELIREQILLHTKAEIPHSVAIVIEKIEQTPKITRVFASIVVERNSQKGILIGKKGNMLKEIGTKSRQQIQKLIDGQVYLELFVKVQPKWRQSRGRLAEFGYKPE